MHPGGRHRTQRRQTPSVVLRGLGNAKYKRKTREAAKVEGRGLYGGRAGAERLSALGPVGTDTSKPFLEDASWLIAIFGRRKGEHQGQLPKNYYAPETVNIAAEFPIADLHHAGLATLTHTPNAMSFLSGLLKRAWAAARLSCPARPVHRNDRRERERTLNHGAPSEIIGASLLPIRGNLL